MLLKILTIVIVICLASTAPALSFESENKRDSDFSFHRFLIKKPLSAVLYHGPTPIVVNHGPYKPGHKRYIHSSDFVFANPSLLPAPGGLCSHEFEGELLKDYVAINYGVKNGFDGFRVHRISELGIKKMKNCLYRMDNKKIPFQGLEILAINPIPKSNQRYWDFEKKKIQNYLYYCFLSKDTFIVSTSIGYIKHQEALLKLPLKVGPSKDIELIAPDFYKTAKPDSYRAYCSFGSNGNYPSKEICKHIEAVSFSRDGNLSMSPFEVLIVTREDNIEHAKLVISQFDDFGFPKREIRKIGPKKFLLTVYTDAMYFYGRLQFLLTIGYNPNMQ